MLDGFSQRGRSYPIQRKPNANGIRDFRNPFKAVVMPTTAGFWLYVKDRATNPAHMATGFFLDVVSKPLAAMPRPPALSTSGYRFQSVQDPIGAIAEVTRHRRAAV